MMGSKECAFAPRINVSLEPFAPTDHCYRHPHKSLDCSFVRARRSLLCSCRSAFH